MDVKLSTIDSANGGTVLIDSIRGLKIALDRGLSGAIESVCSYAFKTGSRKRLIDAIRGLKEFAEGD
jgi:myo-inositol-1-phosphate synthase